MMSTWFSVGSKKISNISTRESILCFSRHGSPAIDDSDLRELQCACHEPAMRHIYYTENDVRFVLSKMQCARGDLSFVFIYNIV
jgi:hypothetical protein